MDIEKLKSKFLSALEKVTSEENLEALRIEALGKKGEVSLALRELGKMSPDLRKDVAPKLNDLRVNLVEEISKRKEAFATSAQNARLSLECLDLSRPARPFSQGTIHPISQVTEEIIAIFADLGYAVAEGPQLETDWYNFDALNMAPEHPARQEHDTFYMHREEGDNRPPHVLRTHTSPVQIRYMQNNGVPCRVIAPGRVYRADYDQTHTPMFHQYEGLCIGKDISMANLKWTLEEFCKAFFEIPDIELRFRASHFPFTEPSAEVDIRCSWDNGQLKIGEGDDWMEILGCGMVHPNVLAAAGVDAEKWQGFAFGMGIDRLAMLKYGIPDLRAFFDSDLRWLRHYGFSALDRPDLAGGLSK